MLKPLDPTNRPVQDQNPRGILREEFPTDPQDKPKNTQKRSQKDQRKQPSKIKKFKRSPILRQALARPHRYRFWRFLTQSFTITVLYIVPFMGLAQVDLFSGQHKALFKTVDAVSGFAAIFTAMAALYVITFLANFFFGRLLCGWGCPMAQVSRFSEQLELKSKSKLHSLKKYLQGAIYGFLLGGGILFWWVDISVFYQGDITAISVASMFWLSLTTLFFLHGKYWRWSFCQKVCPIGLYYSVVHVKGPAGIHFHPQLETCKDCDACQMICPVELNPRSLDTTIEGPGGLSLENLPADHHCLRCGDCIQACEFIFRNEPEKALPLTFDSFESEEDSEAKELAQKDL